MASRQEKIDTVAASPAAVAAHDKAAWTGLFARDALVNDPVGSRPHRGAAAISRFYDTFIAPNDIRFEVDHDVVCGMTVVRDVVIKTRMGNGETVDVPTHIRYGLVEEEGGLRICSLRAYWELMPMVWGALTSGFAGLVLYTRLSVRMLACQGLGGMLGFMRGFAGIGRRGKRRAEALLTALARGDAAAAGGVLAPEATLEYPAGTPCTAADLGSRMQGLTWTKLMAAGHCVSATVYLGEARGVALMEFDARRRIDRVRLYIEEASTR